MKLAILISIVAIRALPVFGEEITLEDAIDMALSNSPGAALAESNYLQGRAGWWEGLGAITPSVSVTYSGGKNYDRDAFEFNGQTYRLKFVKDGKVIWVDVDAATGRIKGRSRP